MTARPLSQGIRPLGMLPRDWLTQNGWRMIEDGVLFPYQCQWIDPITGRAEDFLRAKEIQEGREAEHE